MTPTGIYFHRVHGAKTMYVVDGDQAVARHPNEWSDKPWTDAEAAKAKAIDDAETAARVTSAEAEVARTEAISAKAAAAAATAARDGTPSAKPARIPDGPILAALALLAEHTPDLMSAAGQLRHQTEVDRIRDRDARMAGGNAPSKGNR